MRINRLLAMVLIISERKIITGKELAEHFEVSLRTVYRDIEEISKAGVPIVALGGKGGGYSIMENYTLKNMFLNKPEVQKLVSVMDGLTGVFGKNDSFNDIVLKFKNSHENLESKSMEINMSHFSMEGELKDFLVKLNEAIQESKLVEFDYINRNLKFQRRTVEPIKIKFSGGVWYLIAYCRNREDYRRFKLVRMTDISLGEGFDREDISEEELNRIFDQSYKNNIEVILKFKESMGEQLREYFCKECIKKESDGSYIVKESFPKEEGLLKFILGFGRECCVLEPIDLRDEIKLYIENMLQVYKKK